MDKPHMAVLLDSIPHQPIVDSDPELWAKTALPLVRKVFAEIEAKERAKQIKHEDESVERSDLPALSAGQEAA